ncbi:MAG: YopX family protein [Nitrosomonadaceae bacterium]
MREHKYEAWDTVNNIMYRVGDDYGTISPLGVIRYFLDGQPVILREWTGLTDKNGVDVFEGDILDYAWDNDDDYDLYVVEWESGGFVPNDAPMCDYEVIGNRFEDPELLEAC